MHEFKLQVPAYERKQEKARAGGGEGFGTAPSRLHAGDRVPTTMRAQETRSDAKLAARQNRLSSGVHGREQSTAAVRSVELVSYVARDVYGRGFNVLLMFLVFHTRDAALGRNSVER